MKARTMVAIIFMTGSAIRADLSEAGDLLIKEVPCVLIYSVPPQKDLWRGRRWWRSRAGKLHERSLPIHLAVPILAVLGGWRWPGSAPVIRTGCRHVVPLCSKSLEPAQFSYPAGSPRWGRNRKGAQLGQRVTRAGARLPEPLVPGAILLQR